ncbi:MAG TPA: hypothetical protein VHE81_19325, partial [Lacipirellulaceae bacterium]|nr:hypothetical protein [Lacipirellulaceae bacterium]
MALSCTVAVADRWDNNNRRSDQSGQSGRSFRGGSTASHNFSNAQPSSQSFGSGSRRVVQGQSEGSSSHSYNSGSPSGAVSRQAFGVQSRRGGSDDNATAALPTLGGQGSMHFFDGAARNRNHGLETPYSRGWSRQTTAFGAADQRTLQRSSDNASDSSRAGTTTFDWRTGNHNSSSSSDRSAQTQRGNDSSRGDGQWQWRGKQLRSQDTAAPVTNDKVRDFLQLRRDGSVNQAGVESGPGFNRQFSRSGNPSSLSRVTNDELRRFKMNDQMNEARADGDRAWTKQFGNKQGSVGESSRHRSAGKPFVGKNGTGFGNATADGKNSFGNEHKFDQASLNRTYNDWRKNAVGGGRHASAD